MHSRPMKRSPMKRFFNAIFIIVLIIAIAFAGLIAFISLTEYKPDKVERIRIYGNSSKGVKKGDSIKMMSWNIGYGALGDNADFFMDGGNHVLTSSKNRVKKNIKSISGEIHKQSPDITMIQEVDEDSRRSYHINQVEKLGKAMDGSEYYYARNYKAAFVPYPIPPLGKMDSGTNGTIKVDGTTVTWQNAVDAMNAALNGSEWRYELTGELPTLKKQ